MPRACYHVEARPLSQGAPAPCQSVPGKLPEEASDSSRRLTPGSLGQSDLELCTGSLGLTWGSIPLELKDIPTPRHHPGAATVRPNALGP